MYTGSFKEAINALEALQGVHFMIEEYTIKQIIGTPTVTEEACGYIVEKPTNCLPYEYRVKIMKEENSPITIRISSYKYETCKEFHFIEGKLIDKQEGK